MRGIVRKGLRAKSGQPFGKEERDYLDHLIGAKSARADTYPRSLQGGSSWIPGGDLRWPPGGPWGLRPKPLLTGRQDERVEVGIEMAGGPGGVSARFALEVMEHVFSK